MFATGGAASASIPFRRPICYPPHLSSIPGHHSPCCMERERKSWWDRFWSWRENSQREEDSANGSDGEPKRKEEEQIEEKWEELPTNGFDDDDSVSSAMVRHIIIHSPLPSPPPTPPRGSPSPPPFPAGVTSGDIHLGLDEAFGDVRKLVLEGKNPSRAAARWEERSRLLLHSVFPLHGRRDMTQEDQDERNARKGVVKLTEGGLKKQPPCRMQATFSPGDVWDHVLDNIPGRVRARHLYFHYDELHSAGAGEREYQEELNSNNNSKLDLEKLAPDRETYENWMASIAKILQEEREDSAHHDLEMAIDPSLSVQELKEKLRGLAPNDETYNRWAEGVEKLNGNIEREKAKREQEREKEKMEEEDDGDAERRKKIVDALNCTEDMIEEDEEEEFEDSQAMFPPSPQAPKIPMKPCSKHGGDERVSSVATKLIHMMTFCFHVEETVSCMRAFHAGQLRPPFITTPKDPRLDEYLEDFCVNWLVKEEDQFLKDCCRCQDCPSDLVQEMLWGIIEARKKTRGQDKNMKEIFLQCYMNKSSYIKDILMTPLQKAKEKKEEEEKLAEATGGGGGGGGEKEKSIRVPLGELSQNGQSG